MAIPVLTSIHKALGLTAWQVAFIGLLVVFAANYLTMVFTQKVTRSKPLKAPDTAEGFTDGSAAEESKYEWLDNNRLYDSFYASIYDQLVQGSQRTQVEVKLLLDKWKIAGRAKNELRILDIGCGTGLAPIAFAKEGVGRVVGLDKSKAMLEYAEKTNLAKFAGKAGSLSQDGVLAKSALTPHQKDAIKWREADVIDPAACKPQEFDCACLLYFSVYYIRDLDGLFRNCALWIAPGGKLAVQVVNKYKFDPILDSASPFMFSVQKYSKERVMKSHVKFDKFDYDAVFHLDGENSETAAEFRETFRFKDGSVRRQRHSFNMPAISVIVNKAKAAGWIYDGYIDELASGFEYSYLLCFHH